MLSVHRQYLTVRVCECMRKERSWGQECACERVSVCISTFACLCLCRLTVLFVCAHSCVPICAVQISHRRGESSLNQKSDSLPSLGVCMCMRVCVRAQVHALPRLLMFPPPPKSESLLGFSATFRVPLLKFSSFYFKHLPRALLPPLLLLLLRSLLLCFTLQHSTTLCVCIHARFKQQPHLQIKKMHNVTAIFHLPPPTHILVEVIPPF